MQNDPFAVFEAEGDPEIDKMTQPKKKVRHDIESALVANLMGEENKLNEDGEGSDN